ncbi:MAG: ATP-binding protein, partial [Terriglobia bacterium]
MPLDKPLDDLSESDLDQLVLDGTAECKTIEYKLILPGKSEGDTKEFLADASSFANSAGGYLIYGIRAVKGQPVELCGLPEDTNGDAEILRLESCIRTGIAQRMHGVHSRTVPLRSGKVALIIRIPRSFAAPHMVTYKGSSRFFSRASNGRYQLDVGEIRTAFLLSESAAERCRDFRLDRLSRIQGNDTPVPMEKGAKVVLHITPIGPTTQPTVLASDVANKLRGTSFVSPIYDTGYNLGYNFDGIFTYSPGETAGLAGSYLQVFRSGNLETVNHRILRHQVIPSETFEEGLIESLPRYFEALKMLNIDAPVFIMFSLVGVLGFRMAVPRSDHSKEIDRDTLV